MFDEKLSIAIEEERSLGSIKQNHKQDNISETSDIEQLTASYRLRHMDIANTESNTASAPFPLTSERDQVARKRLQKSLTRLNDQIEEQNKARRGKVTGTSFPTLPMIVVPDDAVTIKLIGKQRGGVSMKPKKNDHGVYQIESEEEHRYVNKYSVQWDTWPSN